MYKKLCILFSLVSSLINLGYAQTIFSENFETGAQWSYVTITTSDNSWIVSNTSCKIAGSYSLQVYDSWVPTYCSYYTGDNCNKIAYKQFSSAGYQSLVLSFKWKCAGEATYDYGKVVWSSDGSTWNDLATQYQGQSATQTASGIALPAGMNDDATVYIGFRWINDGSAGSAPGFIVDDVSITATAICSAPTSVTATSSASSICTGNSVSFQYSTHSGGNVGGGSWEYEWRDGSGNVVRAWSTTATYTPTLTSSKTYYLYMRSTACNSLVSPASNAVSVSVTPNAASPTSVTATPASPICNGSSTSLSVNGGLAAYYPFSANVNDASGNGLNLSGSGGTFTGGGIQLTTTSSYTSASTDILNTDKYTIAFYMQYTSASDGSWRKIFGFEPSGSDRSPGIWRYPSSMQLHWRHDPGNTGLTEATTFTQGQWYYVVGEKNGATFTVYVDGVQVDQGAVANPKTTGPAVLWFGGANVLLKEFKIYSGTIKWYTVSCGNTLVGSGPVITVSPTSNTTYYVREEGVCNTTSCVNTTINVDNPLSTVNAGEDKYLCGATSTAMTASGSGTWTQIGGTAATITTPTSPTTTITGLSSGTSVFRWSQGNACNSVYDDVLIIKQ